MGRLMDNRDRRGRPAQFPDRLLRDYEAAEMLGRSRATFRQQVKRGELPAPVRDGKLTLWRQSELVAVIERLVAERDKAPA